MHIENHTNLAPFNTLGIAAKAHHLARIQSDADVRACLALPGLGAGDKFVLGGGSNIVLIGDVHALVLKVEVKGIRLLSETDSHWLLEAGAGEQWHDVVRFSIDAGYAGLENLALIPGTVGAAPVQNIGAYGAELQDFFDSLDAVDLVTGRSVSLSKAQCHFGYRDSVFKHALAGKALITRVRLRLAKQWQAKIGYADLERKVQENPQLAVTPRQIFDWVCAIRQAKLPDPARIGNAGSFFKNPSVTPEQCADIIGREPNLVYYPMPDGSFKLAAGWLIDACGWRGKSMGQAGVYEQQALVLVNRGQASGSEITTLARAIQTSVYERFGIRLEPEPVVVHYPQAAASALISDPI